MQLFEMKHPESWNPAVLLAAGFALGLGAAWCGIPVIAGWDEPWIGFAGSFGGSVVGGMLTLAAGWLAWVGVQEQIRAVERRATDEEHRAIQLADWYAKNSDAALVRLQRNCTEFLDRPRQPFVGFDQSGIDEITDEFARRKTVFERDLDWCCDRLPPYILDPVRQLQRNIAHIEQKLGEARNAIAVDAVRCATAEVLGDTDFLTRAIERWRYE